ncbi:MAG TPA: ABC transporter permease [Terriglobales bacterium]|jgi:predicted permease|nr:ABC transporter permease [Terriglobales bacterium]
MDTLMQDLRFGFRQLRRTPAFAVVAILTLALGIGANTAIFSVMNAVLLRALPGSNPDRLVYLHYQDQPERTAQTGYDDASISQPVFEQLRQEHRVFSDLMAFVPLSAGKIGIRFGDDLQQGRGDMVSGNFFSGLGVRAAIGRTFSLDDEKNHTQTAVLSYAYWTTRFNRDTQVIGQTLYVKAVPFTIVGVAAPGFTGLERKTAVDVWVPFQNRPDVKPWGASPQEPTSMYGSPDWFFLMMIGRLNPGITEQQALAQINSQYRSIVEQTLGKQTKAENKIELYFTPARGIEGLNSEYKQPLYMLMGMVVLILVIACGNVAMLMIARNASRSREFSVRVALGGSRGQILRQLLIESMVLVSGGALLGWLFAQWATAALASWSELQASLAPDGKVLLFTVAISAVAALLFGLAPLRSATSAPVALALKNSALSSQQDKEKVRSGKLVVALQMSLCLVLLVGAGLLLRTLQNLGRANLGFRASGLLVFGIDPPAGIRGDQQVAQFYTTLLERLKTIPAVESATVMGNRIGAGWSNNTGVHVDGADPTPGKFPAVRWNPVGPDYFRVLGAQLQLGRDISLADTAASPRVAIVNQTFIDRYLAGRSPLGHQIALETYGDKFGEPYSIVGVVPDVKYTAVREKARPMAWVPYTQVPGASTMQVELRAKENPAYLLDDARRIVREFGPDIPLLEPMTQTEQLQESYSSEQLFSRLAVFFGALAAFLVAIGLYGTLAYRVSRRTAEIGVRMALGAQRKQVLWMILRESLVMAVVGIGVGLPLAFAGARLLKSMLFGLSPSDPLTFLLALLGIAGVALISALLPARRASSVDPMVALRYE